MTSATYTAGALLHGGEKGREEIKLSKPAIQFDREEEASCFVE